MHCSSKNFKHHHCTAELLHYATVPRNGLGHILETDVHYPKTEGHRHQTICQASMKYDLQEWAVSALTKAQYGTKSASR